MIMFVSSCFIDEVLSMDMLGSFGTMQVSVGLDLGSQLSAGAATAGALASAASGFLGGGGEAEKDWKLERSRIVES